MQSLDALAILALLFNMGFIPPTSINLDSTYDALEDLSAVDSVPHCTYNLGTTTNPPKFDPFDTIPQYEDNGIKYREYRALFYEDH